MKIILFGCKNTTLHVAKWAQESGYNVHLITISTVKAEEQKVAGYMNLIDYNNLFSSVRVLKRYDLKDSEDQLYIKKLRADVGIAMGWQRLVPESVLKSINKGVFGMHGSAQNLPFGRGRSPMNWSILEGRKWFYTNLFCYMAGVDNGPIVDTSCFSIQNSDTSESLHYKNTLAFIKLLEDNLINIGKGLATFTEQDRGIGSLYPKREPEDGLIDWNDSIHNIERLIRAVTLPFRGAFSYIAGIDVTIVQANIFYEDIESHPFAKAKYGLVCDVFPNGKFLIRCNGGVLIVNEWKSSVRINKNSLLSSSEEPRKFERNDYGFFDI